MQEKIALFVDGSNLYAGQYQLFGPENYLDFGLFLQHIESNLSKKFDNVFFYASYSPQLNNLNKTTKDYFISLFVL